jgi:hypothetical protein
MISHSSFLNAIHDTHTHTGYPTVTGAVPTDDIATCFCHLLCFVVKAVTQ